MSKGFTVTTENIGDVVNDIKKAVRASGRSSFKQYLLVPKSFKVLSNRYRGRGRPRKSDYEWSKFMEVNKVLPGLILK